MQGGTRTLRFCHGPPGGGPRSQQPCNEDCCSGPRRKRTLRMKTEARGGVARPRGVPGSYSDPGPLL